MDGSIVEPPAELALHARNILRRTLGMSAFYVQSGADTNLTVKRAESAMEERIDQLLSMVNGDIRSPRFQHYDLRGNTPRAEIVERSPEYGSFIIDEVPHCVGSVNGWLSVGAYTASRCDTNH
jgi:hypothetical protein